MPKLIDRVPENRFLGMFVGRHHSGKTVAELSFPKPLDVDDFDGRIGGGQVPWLDLNGITYDYWPPKMPGLITKLNEKLALKMDAAKLTAPGITGGLPKTQVCDSITNQTYAFLSQAVAITHLEKIPGQQDRKKGRWEGGIAVEMPGDYKLEATATYDYMAFMRSIPIQNVIVSAHFVDRYGKLPKEDGTIDPYSESVVLGKKLSIRDKIGENIQTQFDHIFEFERVVDRFYVTFRGELACTGYDWLPSGKHEWTYSKIKKPFYEWMMDFKKAGA